MENASKALLMGAGVLIILLILSAGVFLYSSYTRQSQEYSLMIAITELQKFNSNFEVYIGRSNISAQEVATVVNLAKEYNGQVDIEIRNKNNVTQTYTTPENFVMKFFNSTFSCVDSKYDAGKIIKLKFKENS